MSIEIPNVKVERFAIIDSTNSEAKRRFSGLEPSLYPSLHKTLLVAEEQSAGRGRLGRSFYSPSKTGVYFSLIFVDKAISAPSTITASAAVAVCRAIATVFSVSAQIKWVNDVLVDGKKVCGILTEGIVNPQSGKIEAAIIGIGIDILKNGDMPKALETTVGKICDAPSPTLKKNAKGDTNEDAVEAIAPNVNGETNEDSADIAAPNAIGIVSAADLEKWLSEKKDCLIQETVLQLLKILENPDEEFSNAMQEYKERSTLLGKTLTFSPVIGDDKTHFQCTVLDITDDAKLLVQMSDGSQKTLESGEVTMHKNEALAEQL